MKLQNKIKQTVSPAWLLANIREFRMTKKELSKQLGYDDTYISRIMGKAKIPDRAKSLLYFYFENRKNEVNKSAIKMITDEIKQYTTVFVKLRTLDLNILPKLISTLPDHIYIDVSKTEKTVHLLLKHHKPTDNQPTTSTLDFL